MVITKDNFLHRHPSLYEAFEPDAQQGMAKFIQSVLETYGISGKVLDVGSGLGREAAYLSAAGYQTTGVDLCPEMLAWAQAHYPAVRFHLGDQRTFRLPETFDAVYSVGSTFLYNKTNEEAAQTLANFRAHLRPGGLLYLDMRNAMFFLTEEGQRWLTEELMERAVYRDAPVTLKTRFSMDYRNQLLLRDYHWELGEEGEVVEHLEHRLFFPKEMEALLANSGFRTVTLFDSPAPHIGQFVPGEEVLFGRTLTGRRMQVIGLAV